MQKIADKVANSQLKNNKSLVLFKQQVSGKAPKLSTQDNKTILKCYIHEQFQFYEYFFNKVTIGQPQYDLKKFLPIYEGVLCLQNKPDIQYNDGQNQDINTWLQHVKIRYEAKNQDNKFILMQNFLFQLKNPNILDIKIGGRQQKPKKITKSVAKYKIKLNGMLKTKQDSTTEFISKYILNQITQLDQIIKYIAYFFICTFKTGKDKQNAIISIIDQLKNLVLAIRSATKWKFVSTSICIVYDSRTSQALVKYIDFGRAFFCQINQKYDEDTSAGLQFIIQVLNHILKNSKQYQNVTIQKRQTQVVPKAKIAKFENKNYNENN